jgi:CheY-like chemotaxis protein
LEQVGIPWRLGQPASRLKIPHPDIEGAMATVLVVDDERPVRELAARMLQETGYGTIQAVGGQDAWRQLRRVAGKVEAIVADVVMPNMTGTELLARVQDDFPELLVGVVNRILGMESRPAAS